MSGQLIGGIIGGVIGFFAGGNVAAGWAIGSAIGGALDPQKIEGPRLQDLKVQVSSYGAAIPIIHGGCQVSGNVIWSTDLVEHEVETGGKGGGPVVTNHTYSVSCAILIGEGPISGIRRIWADAELIYDVSDPGTLVPEGTAVPAEDAARGAASALLRTYFTFYQGTEDQLPDPTMEAVLGVDNVPAYLGISYIVFTDIPLQKYGNRIPNMRFETASEPAPSSEGFITYEPLKIYEWSVSGGPVHSAGPTTYSNGQTTLAGVVASLPAHTREYLGHTSIARQYLSFYNYNPDGENLGVIGSPAFVSGHWFVQRPNIVSFTVGATSDGNWSAYAIGAGLTKADWNGPRTALINNFMAPTGQVGYVGSLVRVVSIQPGGPYAPPPWGGGGYAGVGDNAPNAWGDGMLPEYFTAFIGLTPSSVTAERQPAPPPDTPGCGVGDPCLLGIAQVPGRPNFCIDCDGNVTRRAAITYEVVSGSYQQLAAVTYVNGLLVQNGLGPVVPAGGGTAEFWQAARDAAVARGDMLAGASFPVSVSQVARGTGTPADAEIGDEANTTLVAIVENILRLAGMVPEQYDLTALDGILVQGYPIGRQMPARAAILQLQQVFWWDFVESGRVIKAVLRGAEPIVTIGPDDLAATEGEEAVVRVMPSRGQESELPATLAVNYPVRANEYEIGTQRARRTTTSSTQVQTMEFAVVMPDLKAAEVADVLMYSSWTNRTVRQWSTTRKFTQYEPTDLVEVNDGEFTYILRITEKSEEGPVIKWTGVDEKPATYAPIVTPAVPGSGGSGVDGGSSGVTFDGPMKLELIDAPIILQANDDPGIYAAAAGYRDGWPGGFAFRSEDDGTTFASVQTMTREATMGYAQGVLPTFEGGNTVDEQNTVTVRLHSGALSSITHAQLMNGGNLLLIGNEYVNFKRAEQLGTDLYILSGFLRGRYNTDVQDHALNERVVLMDANIYRIPDELSDIGAPTVWQGVTSGQIQADALEQDFTNTAAGLKPPAAVHVHAVNLGGGNYRIQWTPRTRFGGSWRNGVDAARSEASENYIVLVNGVTVATTGDRFADVMASPGDSVVVYAMSSTVGRGFPAELEIA